MKLTPTPVALCAERLGLELHTPDRVRFIVDTLADLQPDALVVVSYGQILTSKLLGIAPHGGINLHASLLPRWRGAAPIHRALAAGDEYTGVATMRMERTLDTGAVLLEHRLRIRDDHDAENLEAELADAGAPLMLQTLTGLAAGTLADRPQDNAHTTYAHMLVKEDGYLDFRSHSAVQVDRIVRAFAKRPGTLVNINDVPVKVLAGVITRVASTAAPGTVLGSDATGLHVCTTENNYVIQTLQPPGKPALQASAYANGARLTYPCIASAPMTPAT